MGHKTLARMKRTILGWNLWVDLVRGHHLKRWTRKLTLNSLDIADEKSYNGSDAQTGVRED